MGLHAMADKRAFMKKVQMVFDVEDQCVFVTKVQWVVCYEGQMDVGQEGIVEDNWEYQMVVSTVRGR